MKRIMIENRSICGLY